MALMVLRRARADVPAAVQDAAMRARSRPGCSACKTPTAAGRASIADNDKQWLTEVPFADHNAMIDPSTADITGRVLESLSHFAEFTPAHPVVRRALDFLRRDQTSDGAWYGRWGVNYIYGTWQVLRGVAAIGENLEAPYVRRGVRWLQDHQNADGGWGESIASYDDPSQRGVGASTPSQTAWALMGLLAGGESDGAAVRRGIVWLLERQDADGTWAARGLDRHRVPQGLLSQLPQLPALLPADGAGAVREGADQIAVFRLTDRPGRERTSCCCRR